MIELPVYNQEGKELEKVQLDPAVLGSVVRNALLKQAIVMYHANKRQGTAANKSRGMKAGSTRKLYKQKGTGRARVGNNRTCVRKGGGVAFAKYARDFSQKMPKKQRRLARNSAILAKIKADNLTIIDKIEFTAPKTKEFAAILKNLNIDRSCLVAIEDYNQNVYKSVRNIPKVDVLEVDQLNAGDICNKVKLLMTKKSLESLVNPQVEAEN